MEVGRFTIPNEYISAGLPKYIGQIFASGYPLWGKLAVDEKTKIKKVYSLEFNEKAVARCLKNGTSLTSK